MLDSSFEDIVRELDRRYCLAEQNREWQDHRFVPEAADWPTLHIDDVSGIPFLNDIVGVELYQLRARVRARTGDIYAATCPGQDDYEAYARDRLGLGRARFLRADGADTPIEITQACRRGAAFDTLAAQARTSGRLLIHPYMGIRPVWELARELARAADVPVRVVGPPPAVTWFANDKSDLSSVAEALFGPDVLVAMRRGNTPGGLADHLVELASDGWAQVALKMTRCASAMGNRVLAGPDVLAMERPALLAEVHRFLADKEWLEGSEVLAVSWEDNRCSPSSQLWIPPLGDGPPVVDGLYEQLLVGPERVFLGSVPSRLPEHIDKRLAEISLGVGRVYQALGYTGRCSFDFIVPDGQVRFVECNGRWGGTSTPMHLLDRIFPQGRPAYRARDYVSPAFAGATFSDLAGAIGDALYDARTGTGRYILYNVGCLPVGKFDVIALGATVDDASRALEEELPGRVPHA